MGHLILAMNSLPNNAPFDCRNQDPGYPVVICYHLMNSCIGKDFYNLRSTQFVSLAALPRSIFHIIVLCTQKKMCRVTTSWSVAFMKDAKILGNRTNKLLVCDAVGCKVVSVMSQMSVTLTVQACSPKPTSCFGVWNGAIKNSFFQWRRWREQAVRWVLRLELFRHRSSLQGLVLPAAL